MSGRNFFPSWFKIKNNNFTALHGRFFISLLLFSPHSQIFILLCIGFMEFIIFMIIFYLNIDTAFWIIYENYVIDPCLSDGGKGWYQ